MIVGLQRKQYGQRQDVGVEASIVKGPSHRWRCLQLSAASFAFLSACAYASSSRTVTSIARIHCT